MVVISQKTKKKFLYKAENNLIQKYPEFSSKNLFLEQASSMFYFILSFLLFCGMIFSSAPFNNILMIGNILYLLSMLFKFFISLAGLIISITNKGKIFKEILDKDLPTYSILIPLYKESEVISQLLKALDKISYPTSKLEIFLLVEEDDIVTIDELSKHTLSSHFKLLLVPYSEPRTKPKACNYGLNFASGKYVVIYDAEDIPDLNQLRNVASRFNELPKEYICIQSKLNFFNREENILSKCFSVEYADWFQFMLPSLHYFGFIIPLGGTSNHFKREKLLEIGTWDPYNVTEDAEIGVRIRLLGYKTALIDSNTLEESPISLDIWVPQRTRWIKGYLQTYIIYLKNFQRHFSKMKIHQILGFHLFIGLPTISYFIMPIGYITSILYFTKLIDTNFISENNILLWKIVFLTSIILLIIKSVASIAYNKWNNMINVVLIYPFYFVLHTFAAYRGLYQLLKKKYSWEKTPHGLTKFKKII